MPDQPISSEELLKRLPPKAKPLSSEELLQRLGQPKALSNEEMLASLGGGAAAQERRSFSGIDPMSGTNMGAGGAAFPAANGVDVGDVGRSLDEDYQRSVNAAIERIPQEFPRAHGAVQGALNVGRKVVGDIKDDPVTGVVRHFTPGGLLEDFPKGITRAGNRAFDVLGGVMAPVAGVADIAEAAVGGPEVTAVPEGRIIGSDGSTGDLLKDALRFGVQLADAPGRATEEVVRRGITDEETAKFGINVGGLLAGGAAARGKPMAQRAAGAAMERLRPTMIRHAPEVIAERFMPKLADVPEFPTPKPPPPQSRLTAGLPERPIDASVGMTPEAIARAEAIAAKRAEFKAGMSAAADEHVARIRANKAAELERYAEAVKAQRRQDLINAGQEVPVEDWSPEARRLYDTLDSAVKAENAPRAPDMPFLDPPPRAPRAATLDSPAPVPDVPPEVAPAPVPDAPAPVATPPVAPGRLGARPLTGRRGQSGAIAGEMLNPVAVHDALDTRFSQGIKGVVAMAGEAWERTLDADIPVPGVMSAVRKAEFIRQKAVEMATHPARQAGIEFEHAQLMGRKSIARRAAIERAGTFSDLVKDMPEPVMEDVYRYMSSEADALPPEAAHLKPQIDAESAYIHALGREMVDLGGMSEEAFAQYQRYLPRMYAEMETRKRMGTGRAYSMADNFLRSDAFATHIRNVDKKQAKAVAAKHGGYAVTSKGGIVSVKFKTPEARKAFRAEMKKTLGQDRMKSSYNTNPISSEMRAELGEILDPRAGVYTAILRAKAKIANLKFADDIQKLPGAVLDDVGDGVVPEGYTRIEGKWAGKLNGKLVSDPIAKYLTTEFTKNDIPTHLGWIEALRGFNRGFKKQKTIWSLPTAMRQYVGNTLFMQLAGVDPLNPGNWTTMVEGARNLTKSGKYFDEMVENSVLDDHALPTGDFNSWMENFDGDMGTAEKIGMAFSDPIALTKLGRNIEGKLGSFYNVADRWAKSTAYVKARESGMSPRQATLHVNRYFPNYSMVGEGTRFMRDFVFGAPFFTFKVETARILKNAVMDHPLRAARAILYLKVMQEALGAGLDEAEVEGVEKGMGGGAMPTNWRDDQGRPIVLDTRWINPAGDFLRPPDRYGADDTLDWLFDLTGIQESPAIEAGRITLGGQDRFGRHVSPEGAGFGEQVTDRAAALAQMVAPGQLRYAERIRKAALDEPAKPGRDPEELWMAILAGTIGIPFRVFDAQADAAAIEKKAERLVRDAEIPEDQDRFIDEAFERLDTLGAAADRAEREARR